MQLLAISVESLPKTNPLWVPCVVMHQCMHPCLRIQELLICKVLRLEGDSTCHWPGHHWTDLHIRLKRFYNCSICLWSAVHPDIIIMHRVWFPRQESGAPDMQDQSFGIVAEQMPYNWGDTLPDKTRKHAGHLSTKDAYAWHSFTAEHAQEDHAQEDLRGCAHSVPLRKLMSYRLRELKHFCTTMSTSGKRPRSGYKQEPTHALRECTHQKTRRAGPEGHKQAVLC